MRVPIGQRVVSMKFSEAEENSTSVRSSRHHRTSQERVSQGESKHTFLDTVKDLESRIVKFGNVDNMDRHKRKKTNLSYYDATDPFLDDHPSADKFKNHVVIPSIYDFFAFNGSLTDFVKS